LLLEDDQETAETLAKGLGQEGHEVAVARDVPTALALVAETNFDAAVLDLMVPGGSGYDVLEVLRRAEPRVPVLLLTARSAVEERVLGLDGGADDYLVKPFSARELLVRVGALARYSALETSAVIRERVPLLARAVPFVGDRQIRNRGTLGGNIANASPAADTPPALLVYDAELELLAWEAGKQAGWEDMEDYDHYPEKQ
jgi:DNA-binding response OmpR family regulator